MPTTTLWLWVVFNVLVVILLIVDLKVFHRQAHEVSVREALVWTAIWIALAVAFGIGVYFWRGGTVATQYFAAYLVEKSLSVDNLFVFLLVFSYFAVPPRFQHRILFWGILGALVMRAIFIFAGVSLIRNFAWITYVFGAFLVFTGVRLAVRGDHQVAPDRNPLLKLMRRLLPVTDSIEGDHFFVRHEGRLMATPLLIVLVAIESTDVVFAVDSIPAVLAISLDPFIVYTSNVFAILGLRALYFALAGLMPLFHYLKYGLMLVLVFVGVKMILAHHVHIPAVLALGAIGIILGGSVVLSLVKPPPRAS